MCRSKLGLKNYPFRNARIPLRPAAQKFPVLFPAKIPYFCEQPCRMNNKSQILKNAREVLQTEREGLIRLEESLDENFVKVVNLIAASKGRVILSGIGKSAIVGQKISATLNSTGTPSVFMHAADATHGDLGTIRNEDIVIIISKSGNTPEIKWLASLIKNLGNPLVAMTANPESYLASQAGYLLYTPVEKEAWHNLAPTTSTVAQMALGDALAIALLKEKNFTKDDFARYHPGGTLGKQLLLRVEHLLENKNKPLVAEDTPIQDVIVEITENRVGATAVADKNGKVTGIITDGDIRRMLQKHREIHNIKAGDIMSRNPKSTPLSTLAADALKKMKNHNISQLIVHDKNGEYVGIIHIHEILKEGIMP